MLSAQEEFWDMSSSTLAGTATMARRTRMHCDESPPMAEKLFLSHTARTSRFVRITPLSATCTNPNNSLLMSYLFLTDVTCAIQAGRVPCISTQELFMRMPSSPHNFAQLYSSLLSGARPLPSDIKADEDSLLLLIGICADILFIQHSFSYLLLAADLSTQTRPNPYAPLSPPAEALRYRFILNAALMRWYQHFGDIASPNILLMFYFCRLLLALPDVLKLPSLAGYPSSSERASMVPDMSATAIPRVSDEALNFSWQILENSHTRTEIFGGNTAIWVPVVLFYAALTIWAHLEQQGSSKNLMTGTLRTLNIFKDELSHLPWPCCVEMCHTLDRLMKKPSTKRNEHAHHVGGLYDTRD